MFKKLILCATLLFAPLVVMADDVVEEDGNYRHTYDRFTKTNSYGWRSPYLEIGDDIVIAHLIETALIIHEPKETSFMLTLIFRHTDDTGDYDFSECGDVDWLVDNQVIEPKQIQMSNTELHIDGDILHSFMSEADYKTIMKSKKTEYRVCGNEFKLDNDTKQGMKRAYASYLKNKNK